MLKNNDHKWHLSSLYFSHILCLMTLLIFPLNLLPLLYFHLLSWSVLLLMLTVANFDLRVTKRLASSCLYHTLYNTIQQNRNVWQKRLARLTDACSSTFMYYLATCMNSKIISKQVEIFIQIKFCKGQTDSGPNSLQITGEIAAI